MDRRVKLIIGVILLVLGVYGTFYFRDIPMLVLSCAFILVSFGFFAKAGEKDKVVE